MTKPKMQNDTQLTNEEKLLLTMLESSFGPEINKYLNDNSVIEIMVNPDSKLWVDYLGRGRVDTGIKFSSVSAKQIIELVASGSNSICNYANPIISAELPGSGARFQGMLPPIVAKPTFTIRKKAILVYTLQDYVDQKILSINQKNIIINAVKNKKNMLIVGGTQSGKTTFANAVLKEIAKTGDRLVLIEDTLELQCQAEDYLTLRTFNNGIKEITMTELLKSTMRMRPDRIIIGEVRGAEALPLLKAFNTGHPGGLCTIHADGALEGLTRLEELVQEASVTPQKKTIARTINLIIYIEKTVTEDENGKMKHGRTVKEIVTIYPKMTTENEYTYKFEE
ncbi:MAG: P-type conjugative transfer ATPase TrbB [Patescibacteria group bacterium]|jgi:type IV secretion system protein VirB11